MIAQHRESGIKHWRAALGHALPVMALVLGLFYRWLAIADRYILFLYNHNMGPHYPDTSPFSRVTASRYWMAGLVAAGAVMVLYATASWLLKRLLRHYRPPAWWRVWVLCSVPLWVGIPLITMTANQPTLPLVHALRVTLAAWVGLALALMPGKLAAERPAELILLAADGAGLMTWMLSTSNLEVLRRWWVSGNWYRLQMVFMVIVLGLVLLLGVTVVRVWRRALIPGAARMFTAGLCGAYLFMPLVHHVLYTDGYYYITDSDNFSGNELPIQLAAWLSAALLALSAQRLRQRLEAWRARPRPNRACGNSTSRYEIQ
jgi:hypothetical protein